jgi:hypothetical protein
VPHWQKRGRKLWKRSSTRSCTIGACLTAAEPAGPLPKPRGKGFRRQTPPRAAKLDGGVSKPKIVGETPCMAQGGEASFLFHLNHKRAHTSAKGAPSIGVETINDEDSYNNAVASAGHQNPPQAAKLDDRGSKPEIVGGTPCKKARGGEASFLPPRPQEGACSLQRGGGGAAPGSTPSTRTTHTMTTTMMLQALGVKRRGGAQTTRLIEPATGAWRQGPQKVPTRSGRGATAGTVDDDISSGGVLPIMSNDKFASKERGHEPDDNKAAGAAAFRTREVAALSGGEPAAGARRSADGVFVWAVSGNNNMVAASARQLDGYARHHESVKAVGAASEAWSRLRERPHSTPSGRHGLGWASCRHKTPDG